MKETNPISIDVLIQGAGMAGLTTALALKKQGLKVLVLERQKTLSEVGAGIWMAPNALQVFKSLGLEQNIIQSGWPIRQIKIKDAKLKDLQISDLTEAASIFGFETVAIQRRRLQKILYEALDPNEILFANEVASFEQNQNEVLSYLEDGQVVKARALIGADGIHSRIRNLMGLGEHTRHSGTSSYRGIAHAKMPESASHESWEMWAGEHRLGFSQVSGHELYWYLTFKNPKSVTSAKEIFEKSFQKFKWVVENTDQSKIIRTDITDLIRLQHWSQDRVCLIGDAAHATTPNLGQGGAMAIEDAHALSECIRKTGLNPQAFTQFESQRREKVDWIVSMSWQIGQMAHAQNPLLCAIRNFALRSTPQKFAKKQWMRMYRID